MLQFLATAVLLGSLVTASTGISSATLLDAQPSAEAGTTETVRALLKDKLATLRELVPMLEERHRAGIVSIDKVSQAKIEVLKTELELTESAKEQVKLHEKIVAVAKEVEEALKARLASGLIEPMQVLRAKANRLDAEIALERARAKAAGK
jgi:outer membrane protein TolC